MNYCEMKDKPEVCKQLFLLMTFVALNYILSIRIMLFLLVKYMCIFLAHS